MDKMQVKATVTVLSLTPWTFQQSTEINRILHKEPRVVKLIDIFRTATTSIIGILAYGISPM
jgi:hypothetical protein